MRKKRDMEKKIKIQYFVDVVIENKVVKRIVKLAEFECNSPSIRDSLYRLYEYVESWLGMYGYSMDVLCIGVSCIDSAGKIIDYNYKNRVIYNDAFLRGFFYC